MYLNLSRALVLLWLALLTAVSYFIFPGHTYLQSDTQIYLPMLEHLRDSTTYPTDLIALRPHLTFTAYDELTLIVDHLFHNLETTLAALQLSTRFLGFLGIFLIGRHLGLSPTQALLPTAIFALGAIITGPAVLLIEYEPVPRAFAGPLLFLALGLTLRRNDWLAGLVLGSAILFHPPTALPFCAAVAAWLFWYRHHLESPHRRRILAGVAIAILVLLLFAWQQPGVTERQPLFGRIDADIEQLQRFRASYNWLGLWDPYWFAHYTVAALLVIVGARQLGSSTAAFWFQTLAAIGMLSMPVSYLLLDVAKFGLIPQIQPARAAMFITGLAMVAGAVRGVQLARKNNFVASASWFALAFVFPLSSVGDTKITSLFAGPPERWILLLGLSALMPLAVRISLAPKIIPLVALIPLFALPYLAKIKNYPQLADAEILQLSAWAQQNSRTDAVFLFPDVDRSLLPGVFRVRAQRTVWVDRKMGGQINFMPAFGREWWRRWNLVMLGKLLSEPEYAQLGIDYYVLSRWQTPTDRQPIATVGTYRVFAVTRNRLTE
jgi:hypothetical protein